MSGHWFKVVSGACKPKHVPPKPKYIDALVSSTYQADGSLQDVSRALRSKLRDPNSSVVFKALLVIHTLIRAGNAEEVMTYWSGLDGRDGRTLGLKDVVATTDTPQNLSRYANYLQARFKCYAQLKHDPIRTRAEAPASLRHSSRNGANRLRTLTVEKGLLREVGTLQKLLDALVDCKFYLEDTEDDLVMSALRLLVKDLLILFQAVNEGVINVLEHYFEMSHVDATTALKTYKIFCKQCERVVAYLGVAKKLQNVINVNIPNLRHAPVSLAGSLEEYLNDPNFETNRQEYRSSKLVSNGKTGAKSVTPKPTPDAAKPNPPAAASTSNPPEAQKAFTDFFESIESEQQSMFNPNSLSPNTVYFEQQATLQPFNLPPTTFAFSQPAMLGPQSTGFQGGYGRASMGQALFGALNGPSSGPFVHPQQTGFPSTLRPQPTGAANPFRQSVFTFSGPPPAMPMTAQSTGFAPLAAQPTGLNPFAQPPPSFTLSSGDSQQQSSGSGWSSGGQATAIDRTGGAMSAPPSGAGVAEGWESLGASSGARTETGTLTQPLRAQITGSRNPFAMMVGGGPGTVPPVPKMPESAPSLNALAASAFSQSMVQQRMREQAFLLQQQQQQKKTAENDLFGLENESSRVEQEEKEREKEKKEQFTNFFSSQLSKLEGGGKDIQAASNSSSGGGGLFGSVASEFAVTKPKDSGTGWPGSSAGGDAGTGALAIGQLTLGSQPTGFTPMMSAQPTGFGGPSIGAQPTGFGGASMGAQPTGFGGAPAALVAQPTGFGGSSVKPFKPSSTFGASLAAQVQQAGGGQVVESGGPVGGINNGAGGTNGHGHGVSLGGGQLLGGVSGQYSQHQQQQLSVSGSLI